MGQKKKNKNVTMGEKELHKCKYQVKIINHKNESLDKMNRNLRQKMRARKKDLQDERNNFKSFEAQSVSVTDFDKCKEKEAMESTIKQLKDRISTLDKAQQETLRVESEHQKLIELKDGIIQNLQHQISVHDML